MNTAILDLNQVMVSSLMAEMASVKSVDFNEDLCRHFIINAIRNIRLKTKAEYPQFVIATDGRNSWRKSVFPYYKANRKLNRDKSIIDWEKVFSYFAKIRTELNENFTYRLIFNNEAEADDIIGVLSNEIKQQNNKVLIVSGDKDFKQLHGPLVAQYDPVHKKNVTADNYNTELFKHICKGDSGDGIPNILSPDDCFITKTRQKPVTQKLLDVWFKEGIPEEHKDKYQRNERLIVLKFTPEDIKQDILDQFNNSEPKRSKIFNYMVQHKLNNLLQNINDF